MNSSSKSLGHYCLVSKVLWYEEPLLPELIRDAGTKNIVMIKDVPGRTRFQRSNLETLNLFVQGQARSSLVHSRNMSE